MSGLRGWFMNYGLVASILVSTALVAVLAYRLEGSRWRWPMVALALAGIGTAVRILWLRRFIDRQPKAPDQGSHERRITVRSQVKAQRFMSRLKQGILGPAGEGD